MIQSSRRLSSKSSTQGVNWALPHFLHPVPWSEHFFKAVSGNPKYSPHLFPTSQSLVACCSVLKTCCFRNSLGAQWIRIHLPIQGTSVRFLVQEDSLCHGQLSLCILSPRSTALRNLYTTMKGSPCSLQLEKSNRPREAKNK